MQLRKEAGIGRGWLFKAYERTVNWQTPLFARSRKLVQYNSDRNDLERWEKEDSLPGKNWFL